MLPRNGDTALTQHSEGMLEILQSMPDAVLVVDTQGIISFANVHTLSMFDYTAADLVGQSLEVLLPERFRRDHGSFVRRYLDQPYVRPMGLSSSLLGLDRSGREIPVEIYLSPLYLPDALYVIAAIRDITERLKIEDELRRSRDELEQRVQARTRELEEVHEELVREMKERIRAEEQLHQNQVELAHISRLSILGEMTSSLGHEINQPLAAITNYANGCVNRQQAGTLDSDLLVDILHRISAEAARASEIVKRFRSFARREQLQREWINADAMVSEALRLTEFEADRHHIRLQLHITGIMPQVYIDILQIQQVIVNLVRNAIEAMVEPVPPDPSINIYLRQPQKGLVEVAIEDHGHGITAQQRQDLFKPFFSTKQNGLGIGLSLSRSIIEAHGGTMTVSDNDSGVGMTFSFTLPETDGGVDG